MRIRGALHNLGHEIGRNTVKRILLENGFDPIRKKGLSWETFLKAHWEAIAATDFFSVEVITRSGLVRYFFLFVIDLKTRRVNIAGILHQSNGEWMSQIAQNLTDCVERFVRSIKSECLSQIIPFGERHLRHAVKKYTEHYHIERNHQGLDNRLIETRHGVINMSLVVERHERLGGVLNYYERRAA